MIEALARISAGRNMIKTQASLMNRTKTEASSYAFNLRFSAIKVKFRSRYLSRHLARPCEARVSAERR